MKSVKVALEQAITIFVFTFSNGLIVALSDGKVDQNNMALSFLVSLVAGTYAYARLRGIKLKEE